MAQTIPFQSWLADVQRLLKIKQIDEYELEQLRCYWEDGYEPIVAVCSIQALRDGEDPLEPEDYEHDHTD